MEAVFLGTGAAQGNPAAYCRCDSCEQVRKSGGFDIRSRSSMRVGEHYQLDIPPDNYRQMMMRGMDMYDVERILVTHTHSDHFCISAATDKVMSTVTNGKPLAIYMSTPAKQLVEAVVSAYGITDSMKKKRDGTRFELVGLDYFQTYDTGELTLETVRGNHRGNGEEEYSINYLMTTTDGKRMLYALDTGYYTDETWEYLSDKRTDALVMDCTFGGRKDRDEFPYGHLDNASFLKMLERMTSIGFVDSTTAIFATHFNPHQGLNHTGLQKAFDEGDFRVTVAYDGLKITV